MHAKILRCPGSGGIDCDVKGNARAMPALAPATIAGLAKSAGVDVETIRSYERMGLLPKPRRQPGRSGDAAYHREHLERLTFIRRAIELGFTLEAVGELLGLAGGLRTCGDISLVAQRQLSEIRQRIAELSRMEAALAPLAAACPRSGPARDCPLIVALSRPD
jgi:MerR family mercuric resistance operon transcriptional regulator